MVGFEFGSYQTARQNEDSLLCQKKNYSSDDSIVCMFGDLSYQTRVGTGPLVVLDKVVVHITFVSIFTQVG